MRTMLAELGPVAEDDAEAGGGVLARSQPRPLAPLQRLPGPLERLPGPLQGRPASKHRPLSIRSAVKDEGRTPALDGGEGDGLVEEDAVGVGAGVGALEVDDGHALAELDVGHAGVAVEGCLQRRHLRPLPPLPRLLAHWGEGRLYPGGLASGTGPIVVVQSRELLAQSSQLGLDCLQLE